MTATASNTVFTWLEHNYNEPTGTVVLQSTISSADADVPNIVQASSSSSSAIVHNNAGASLTAFQLEKSDNELMSASGVGVSSSSSTSSTIASNTQPVYTTFTCQTIPEPLIAAAPASLQTTSTDIVDNRTLGCYCLLEKDFLKKCYPHVKLKCSVCCESFESLSELADHKHANKNCMNNVMENIEAPETTSTTTINMRPVTAFTTGAEPPQQVKLFLVQMEDPEFDDESFFDIPPTAETKSDVINYF